MSVAQEPQLDAQLAEPPLRPLHVALVVTGIALLFLALSAVWSFYSIGTERGRARKAEQAVARLQTLDETLAYTSRLAVLTGGGDTRWQARYDFAAPQVAEAARDWQSAFAKGSPEAKMGAQIAQAGKDRIAIEKRALALVRAGQGAEARALLASPAYDKRKSAFAKRCAVMDAVAEKRLTRQLRHERILSLASVAAVLVGAIPLFLSTRGLGISFRRWRSRAVAQMHERQKAIDEARQARDRLQEREREHSLALEDARRALETHIGRGKLTDKERLLLSAAVDSLYDVVMISEADPTQPARIVYVNPAFERMTGYARREIIGNSPRLLQGPETDRGVIDGLKARLAKGEPAQIEVINYRKDGSPFWVELNIRPLFDANGWQTHWISIQRDVTDSKKANEHIEWQATHDALTGLPNRTLYQERLGHAITAAEARGSSVGVLFFDLDRFKQINDTLGHMVGDQLLQEVATRLTQKLRSQDTIARVGGDEFTILLPYIDTPEQATKAAQKLLDALNKPFSIDGHELFVTASIGVSIAPQDGSDIATLLKNADVAMYRAKDQGRDNYRVYTETMNAKALDRLALEMHLRKALERDEFHMVYQPQVDIATGQVFGVEALIRWENPVLGRVSPGQFIPVAEETGLIVSIGEWTLREACQQAAIWFREGRPLRMSVNLSARQFEQKDLTARIRAVLERTGLCADYLDLELTEGTLLRGQEAGDILRGLKNLGVRLSVDDFGTGYSSLSYLRTFPLDVLKIDRSFITSMAEDRKSEAVVRALIELAHAVGLEVIAEGVETDAQKLVLHNLKCDAMQGYLFSPPVSAKDVEQLVDLAASQLTATLEAAAVEMVSGSSGVLTRSGTNKAASGEIILAPVKKAPSRKNGAAVIAPDTASLSPAPRADGEGGAEPPRLVAAA